MLYVVKNGFWFSVGRGVAMASTLVVMVAMARWLPKETVGAYNYLFSMATLAGVFALTGMNQAMIRAVALGKEGAFVQMLTTRVRWSLVGSSILAITAFWYWWQGNSELALSFLVFAALLPFIFAFDESNQKYWVGRKSFDIGAKYRIVHGLLATVVVVGVIFYTNELFWIILSYFGVQAVVTFVFYNWTKNKVRNQINDDESVKYGKHLTLMNVLTHIANYADRVILWHMLGPVPLAIYAFAKQPSIKIKQFVPIPILALPKLSEKVLDSETKKGVMQKFYRLFVFSILVTGILWIIAPYIYQWLFPGYPESVDYFRVLVLGLILMPFSLLETALTADKRTRELYIQRMLVPSLKIVLFVALIPFLGIWGVVFAVLVSEVLKSLLNLYFFWRI